MLNNKELETLTHKLYSTLTVLPLSDLLTEDTLKTVTVFKKKSEATYETGITGVLAKTIKDICEYFYPLHFTPILVNKCPDGSYYIVEGWDRLLAAQAMGWITIPCYVLQIPCGAEYIKDIGNDEWEVDRGFYQYSDILPELMYRPTEDLLKALG